MVRVRHTELNDENGQRLHEFVTTGPSQLFEIIRYTDVQLTNAQVLLLRATPVTLVPAPGANLVLFLHGLWIVSDAAAGAWTESTDNLVVQYDGGADATSGIEAGDLVGAAVNTKTVQPTATVLDTSIANEALEIFNTGDGEWGGGNVANTMSIRTWYSVVSSVAFS